MRRFLPKTVAGQLTMLVISGVTLGVGLSSALVLYLVYSGNLGPSPQSLAQARASRIVGVVDSVHDAQTLDAARAFVLRSENDTIAIHLVSSVPKPKDNQPPNSLILDIVKDLEKDWQLTILPHDYSGADERAIFIQATPERILRFDVANHPYVDHILWIQTLSTLVFIVALVTAITIWGMRRVAKKLHSIALAAQAFGRPGYEDMPDLDESGLIEVAQAARALNDMRRRIKKLLAERTQMLAAISHDLRTPLTRLRLRVERLPATASKDLMLGEITFITGMLGEILAYLRETSQNEAAVPLDLPSFIQTICAHFTDIGHEVSYRGVDRFTLKCRPQAMTRAITNLVENAVKFGTKVEVALTVEGSDAIIEVRDEGPGLSPSLMQSVFEPFVKGDTARLQSDKKGFGLGLSIVREIIAAHGGDILLENRAPHGLTARMRLPCSTP